MPLHFLNSPLGALCLVVIAATSLINIYAHWIENGLVDHLLYMALTLTCAAGLFKYTSSTVPEHLASTLIILYAAMGIHNLAVRSVHYVKYRRTSHAKNNQR